MFYSHSTCWSRPSDNFFFFSLSTGLDSSSSSSKASLTKTQWEARTQLKTHVGVARQEEYKRGGLRYRERANSIAAGAGGCVSLHFVEKDVNVVSGDEFCRCRVTRDVDDEAGQFNWLIHSSYVPFPFLLLLSLLCVLKDKSHQQRVCCLSLCASPPALHFLFRQVQLNLLRSPDCLSPSFLKQSNGIKTHQR